MAIILVTFTLGAIGNFVYSKVEVAAVLWTISLFALADFLLSLGKLSVISGVKRFAVDGVVVAFLWLPSYPIMHELYRSQHAALISGDLKPFNGGSSHATISPTIKIDEGGSFIWAGKKGPIFTLDREDFSINRDNRGRLLVSTQVRDGMGNFVGTIKNNHWEVSNSKTACWDKNYTDKALEIMDGRGRIVLQLQFLDPDTIELQVDWRDERGDRVKLVGKGYTDRDGIKPIFKYPSTEHWGEFDEQ